MNRAVKRPLQLKRSRLYLPLSLWFMFSVSTVACFQTGLFVHYFPLTAKHYIALYVYLFAVHLAFSLGYRKGIIRHMVVSMVHREPVRDAKIVLVGVTVYCTAQVVVAQITGLTLQRSLGDLGEARDTALFVYGGSWMNHLLAVLSVFLVPMIGVVLGYWRLMPRNYRYWAVALLTYIPLAAIGGGNRSGIYAVMGYIGIAVMAAHCSGRIKIAMKVWVPVCGIVLASFIAYSNAIIFDRYRLDRSSDYLTWAIQVEEIRNTVRLDHPLLNYVPSALTPTVVQGIFYFGHGYNSLAYSLLKPGEGWGFGLGHASFLVRNFAKIAGEDAFVLAKPYRLQRDEGVPQTLWFTAYMWLASDTTYLGSLLVFYLMGFVFASAWKTVLTQYSFWAVTLLLWMWGGLIIVHNAFIATDYAAWIGYFGSLTVFLFNWYKTGSNARIAERSE